MSIELFLQVHHCLQHNTEPIRLMCLKTVNGQPTHIEFPPSVTVLNQLAASTDNLTIDQVQIPLLHARGLRAGVYEKHQQWSEDMRALYEWIGSCANGLGE